MKIQAADLHRMTYNAIQFSHKDASVAGLTLWAVGHEMMEVWASDDYVALWDHSPVINDSSDEVFALELKTLKELEKELRDREGEISFSVEDGFIQFLSASDFPTTSGESLTPVVRIIHESKPSLHLDAVGPFAIRQDRFTKFRLLKTPGDTEYPVDFIHGQNPQGVGVLLWKLGPTLRGVVGQVDREYLRDYFSEEDVLWG